MKHLILVALIAIAVACTSVTANETPAILSEPDAAARAELRTAVNALLKRDVLLSETAFLETSEITLEPARPRDPGARVATGFEMRKPQKIKLVRSGARCVLIAESGDRIELKHARCKPEANPR